MYTKKGLVSLFVAAVTLAFIMGLAPAGAQDQQQPYSDEMLDQVAHSYVVVSQIRMALQDALADVDDADRARELQERASEQMVRAVEQTGLAVETYNQVMSELQSDDELRATLQEKVENLQ